MKGLIKSLAFFAIFMLVFFSVAQASSYSDSLVQVSSYFEVGDAGNLPTSAQAVTGSGIISDIYGTLSSNNDVDMFKIYIYDPSNFYASTINDNTTVYDTQLFLFDENGYGVLGNDDYSDTWKSYLSSFEGEPGIYFLAISSWDNDPVSDGGLIFPSFPYDDGIYGPTGPGGDQPITGWTNDGKESGVYRIVLGGVQTTAVPVPASIILLGSGLIGFLGLRRARLEL